MINNVNTNLGTTSMDKFYFSTKETKLNSNNISTPKEETIIIDKIEEKTSKNENKKGKEKGKKNDQTQKSSSDELNDTFKELCFKVGKVVELDKMKDSQDTYVLKVDVGEKSLRDIGSGLQKTIPASEILNSNVIVFANLKPKKITYFTSNGMLMCAVSSDEKVIELIRPDNSKSNNII